MPSALPCCLTALGQDSSQLLLFLHISSRHTQCLLVTFGSLIYKYSPGYANPKACVCGATYTDEYRPDISCRASETKAEFNPYYVQCLMQKSDNRAPLGKFQREFSQRGTVPQQADPPHTVVKVTNAAETWSLRSSRTCQFLIPVEVWSRHTLFCSI